MLVALAMAGCAGTQLGSTSVALPPSTAPSPTADIVGGWSRLETCQEELAAFQAAGFPAAATFQWVTSNWVPKASPRSSGFCDGAAAATPHDHFFTADGSFGSRDQNGQQVDYGDYAIASPGVVTFPTHASDFKYSGTIAVHYTISGRQLVFDVQLPAGCVKDSACAEAYGWALSAFFKGGPWIRT